jgi:hypothetical protein
MTHKGLWCQIEATKRLGRIRRGEEEPFMPHDDLEEAWRAAGLPEAA